MAATAADGADKPAHSVLVEAETAFLDAWPALETHWDGAWVWRFANGFTKRANAIQCQDPADSADAEARLDRLTDLSREAGITPLFRETPLCGPELSAVLDRLGWSRFEKSRILFRDRMRSDHAVNHRVAISLRAGPSWVRPQCALQGYDAATRRTLSAIIARMPETATGLTVLDDDGAPAASVLAVSVGELAMFTNVVTAPTHRRAGYGRSAMSAALNLMADAGATRAAIHVLSGNAPAEALYAGLGFTEIGTYCYRKPNA
jgi:N-acetylglutamate synthase